MKRTARFDRFGQKWIIAAAVLCCVLLSVAGFFFFTRKEELSEAEQRIEDRRTDFLARLESGEADRGEDPEASFVAALREENEDVVGWLTIPGTPVNYPVMQTPEDEGYYLYRDFDGKKSNNGCLLVSAGCDVAQGTTNWIIHGHNMRSGAMFGSLKKYRRRGYQKKHDTIFLETPEGKRTYEIVAVFESRIYYEEDDVFKYYQCYNIQSREEFDYFYENVKRLSRYDTGVTAVYGDRFLTLSTCAYHTDNGRLVIVGRERPGE